MSMTPWEWECLVRACAEDKGAVGRAVLSGEFPLFCFAVDQWTDDAAQAVYQRAVDADAVGWVERNCITNSLLLYSAKQGRGVLCGHMFAFTFNRGADTFGVSVFEHFNGRVRTHSHVVPDWVQPKLCAAFMAVSAWFFQLSLCRNVRVQQDTAPRVVRKRNPGAAGIRFSRVFLSAARRGGSGLEREVELTGPAGVAAHHVRGHFKTYTDEAPLFGKLTGTYWVSPHMRGDHAHGTVLQEYVA